MNWKRILSIGMLFVTSGSLAWFLIRLGASPFIACGFCLVLGITLGPSMFAYLYTKK